MPRMELLKSPLLSVSYIPSTICVLSKNIFQSNFWGGGYVRDHSMQHASGGWRTILWFCVYLYMDSGLQHTSPDLSGLYPWSHLYQLISILNHNFMLHYIDWKQILMEWWLSSEEYELLFQRTSVWFPPTWCLRTTSNSSSRGCNTNVFFWPSQALDTYGV